MATAMLASFLMGCSSSSSRQREDADSAARGGGGTNAGGRDAYEERPAETASIDGGAHTEADADGTATDAASDAHDASDAAVDTGGDANLATDGAVESGSSDSNLPPVLSQRVAYEVQGTLTFTPEGAPLGLTLPTSQEITLFVDPVAKAMVAGTPGQASGAPLESIDGHTFTATQAVIVSLPSITCGATITYDSFRFDASRTTVSGQATGRAFVRFSDTGANYAVSFTFTGTVDGAGPTLTLSPPGSIDPLRPLQFVASEPIPFPATAKLTMANDSVDLAARATEGALLVSITRFIQSSDVALRYGTTYNVIVSPWRDLGGNMGRAVADIATLPEPSLVPEDGFEGSATTVGGASTVGQSVLPPISGAKSAAIAALSSIPTLHGPSPFGIASRRLTVRLAVEPGDSVVRLAVRPLGRSEWASTSGSSLLAAVPGGAIVRHILPPTETLPTPFTSPASGDTGRLGAVRTIELPLPVGATTEVVVDFAMRDSSESCGLPPPLAGYLVDDLRVD